MNYVFTTQELEKLAVEKLRAIHPYQPLACYYAHWIVDLKEKTTIRLELEKYEPKGP